MIDSLLPQPPRDQAGTWKFLGLPPTTKTAAELADLLTQQKNPDERAIAVGKWNRYRAEGGAVPTLGNSTIRASGTADAPLNLSGLNLTQVNLKNANLTNVNLEETVLSQADLASATLVGVKLDGANLNRTILTGVTLSGTDLSRTEIRSREWLARGWIQWFLAGIAWGVNWSTVRAVGNLQILTKVSYVMLVVVPLLAALWPQVRQWYAEKALETSEQAKALKRRSVEEQEKASVLRMVIATEKAFDTNNPEATHTLVAVMTKRVREVAEFADLTVKTLDVIERLLKERAALPHLKSAFDEFRHVLHPQTDPLKIEDRADEYDRRAKKAHERAQSLYRTADEYRLPWAWVLAFAAAVFVIFGHLVYQTGCPALVREQTADQFAEERWNHAIVNNVVQQDEVVRALQDLREIAEDLPDTRHSQLVFRHGRVIFFPNDINEYTTPTPPPILRPLIEEGAKAEYSREQYQAYTWAWVSMACYVAGGLLIVANLVLQCTNVAQARGVPAAW